MFLFHFLGKLSSIRNVTSLLLLNWYLPTNKIVSKNNEVSLTRENIRYWSKRIYLPQHFKEPLAMIAIRSPSSSASSIECVVSKIILPFFILFINCHVKRIEYGSIPLVGSSRITTCDKLMRNGSSQFQQETRTCLHIYITLLFPISAIPRDNFLFMPPERALTIVFTLSARPT